MLAAGSDDLAPLSDEFEDSATISQWSRIHQVEGWNADQLQVYDIDQTQSGRMVMQPHTVTWYQDYRGPYSFKSVTGDFVFTTRVQVSDRDDVGDSDPDTIPDDAQFSLSGAMIRTPRAISDPSQWFPGGENYVFLSLGHGTDGGFSYEVKTTFNSNSNLQLTPTSTDTATLQIARIGSQLILLRQTSGDQWVVHQRYNRPDMPETLQVGLVSYTDWEKAGDFDPIFHNQHVLQPGLAPDPTPGQPYEPDLVAGYEYARFARPELPAELDGVDLVNGATDQQLLSFLGDIPNQPAAPPNSTEDVLRFEVGFTDEAGQPITALNEGDTFFAEIVADDLRTNGTGVFSAFVDAIFNANLVSVSGDIVFGDAFPNAQEGDASTAGMIDELGALAGEVPGDGQPQLLARIPLTATAAGTLVVATEQADLLPAHELGLFGFDNPVDVAQVDFGSATIEIQAVPQNAPPVANDDSETMWHDQASVLVDVIANDTTEAGETLQLIQLNPIQTPAGIFEFANDGVRFTPVVGFVGVAFTEYTIADGNGGTDTAILTVDVQRRWHLEAAPHDTNNDGSVSPLDALRIINVMSRMGVVDIQQTSDEQLATIGFYADVNNDNRISSLDALAVINELARQALLRQSEFEALKSALDADTDDEQLLQMMAEDQPTLV